MKHESALTQAAFDSLLAWLDPDDRDRAASKYEQIRQRLIKLFACRGRPDPEDLADETINRVTLKAAQVAEKYVGDPAPYFYGVAQKVFQESLRRRPPPQAPPPPTPEQSEETEREYECLERCMVGLAPASRELILEYYRNDKRAKIDYRKELAARLGIAQNALRIRVHRTKATLETCVRECLGRTLPA